MKPSVSQLLNQTGELTVASHMSKRITDVSAIRPIIYLQANPSADSHLDLNFHHVSPWWYR